MNGKACNTWCWTLFDATKWDEQMKLIKVHKSVIRRFLSRSYLILVFHSGERRSEANTIFEKSSPLHTELTTINFQGNFLYQ